MSNIVNTTQIKFLFIQVLFLFLLSSCSDEKRIHSNYIPTNSSLVLTINTEKIFNDAVFDLMTNNDLINDLSSGPLSRIIQDPSSAGLKMFSKYHLFISGSSLFDAKAGIILPLNDGGDLAEYVSENFGANVIENDGFKVAQITNEHSLVWDDYTAIYYYGVSKGNLINDVKKFFTQTSNQSLASKDSTFFYALNSKAHISTWVKNEDFIKLIDQSLSLVEGMSAINFPFKNKKGVKNVKTVFLTNFNNGNITINQRQYLTPEQIQEEHQFKKENNIASLVPMASSEDPLVLVSSSVKPRVLIELIKLFNLDERWDKQTANFPFLPDINQLSEYFEGDALVLIEGIEKIVKVKQVPDIDDEGNDVLISKEVIEKNPVFSVGLTVKDSVRFNFLLNLLGSSLPKVDGFFNYNDEVYFCVKENYFFLTSSKKAINALNKMNGKLSSNLNSIVLKHSSVYYFNVREILREDQRLEFFNFDAATNLNNILVFKNGITSRGLIEGETKINFVNQENSLVSTLKLFSGLVNSLKSLNSMGIQ